MLLHPSILTDCFAKLPSSHLSGLKTSPSPHTDESLLSETEGTYITYVKYVRLHIDQRQRRTWSFSTAREWLVVPSEFLMGKCNGMISCCSTMRSICDEGGCKRNPVWVWLPLPKILEYNKVRETHLLCNTHPKTGVDQCEVHRMLERQNAPIILPVIYPVSQDSSLIPRG